MRSVGRLLALFALLALFPPVAAGCAGKRSDPEGAASTLRVLYQADERIFGPSWSVEAWFLMFLPLATFDRQGEIVPRLARSWEHSRDFRTWTFHLRPDVRWHDGVPVSAEDVKFSIELSGHPDVLFDDPWHDVDSMAVRDDTTLVIFYGRPKDARNTWMVYWPKHLLEGLDPKRFYAWQFWTHPVGNGPYRYVRHVPKTMVELEANPEFYAGKPAIERVIIRFGEGSGITELLSGDVDLLTWVNPADLPKLAEDPRFRIYYQLHPDIPWLEALLWNHRHRPFGDARVRRAFTLAIDREELRRFLNLPGEIRIADVPFTGHQYRAGVLPPALPYDPARAAAVLETAGWHDADEDGIREREGEPLHFKALVAPGSELEQAAVYVQAALREVGARMEIQTLDNRVLRRRVQSGEFEAVFFPVWNSVDGHLRWIGEYSPIGYDNPEVRRLLASAQETAEPEEEEALYRRIAPMVQADLPITFLIPQVQTYAAHRRVRGLQSPYAADPMVFLEHLWLQPKQ
ncbi:MAG: peptide ABC transporter substrate-binding protein [Gemmatimonadota bacterium]